MESAPKGKPYPTDEEEKKLEQEIVDALKKVGVEQRFQLIALNNLILQKKQLDADMEAEMSEIAKKYGKLSKPITEKSMEVITGAHQPSDLELEKIKSNLTPEEVEKIKENLSNAPIADYWFKVFTNCTQLSQDIFPVDHPILKSLTKIEHHPEEGSENFSLKFFFAPNEYFENDVLTVKFTMLSEQEVDKITGTEIKWKEGKDVTKKQITKKQKNKKTGKNRTVTRTVDADSFFNFFKNLEGKGEATGKGGDDEEDEDDEALEKLDIHFDMARTIIDDILEYHLEFYLGVRDDEPEDFEGGLGGDSDEEGDDDSDDEPPVKSKGKKKN